MPSAPTRFVRRTRSGCPAGGSLSPGEGETTLHRFPSHECSLLAPLVSLRVMLRRFRYLLSAALILCCTLSQQDLSCLENLTFCVSRRGFSREGGPAALLEGHPQLPEGTRHLRKLSLERNDDL